MLPSAPKLYEYANESRFRNIVGQALSANALALSSLRTDVDTVTPSGAIDFTIAADGRVTMKITALANALSVGYIVDAAGYDTDSSGQTLGALATPLEVDLGIKAPGDVFYVTAWFYSAAAGAGDASEIASARRFDYDADVGPESVTDADLADDAVITRTIDDGAVTFAKLAAMTFPTTYGGTGLTSYAQGDMLYYDSGTLLSKLAHPGVANRVLTSTATGPQWVASLTGVDTTGNAATATALQTSRTLWGVGFNGTANVTAAPNFAAGATLGGTISGTPTWASTQAMNISGSSGSTTGNAATATALQTSRTIWGQSFNGTANVSGHLTLGATDRLYLDGGGNTYITEDSADVLALYAGGTRRLYASTAFVAVQTVDLSVDATKKLYLDGGSDTYIYEASANDLRAIVGGTTVWRGTTSFLQIPNVDVYLDATKKLYLDGGSDTYIHESSANNLAYVVGGSTKLTIDASNLYLGSSTHLIVQATQRVYLDGGSDTYLYESSANVLDFVLGGSFIGRFTTGAGSGNPRFRVGTTNNATAANGTYHQHWIGPVNLMVRDNAVDSYFLTNAFYDVSGNWRRFLATSSTLVTLHNGDSGAPQINFAYAASGAADSVISWATTFVIHPSYVYIPPGNKFYLDGGSDTYIDESSANNLTLVAGGAGSLTLNGSHVVLNSIDFILQATKRLYFDGGSDTYLYESSANKISFVVGGSERVYIDGGTFYVNGNSHLIGSGRKIYGNADATHYYIGDPAGDGGLDIMWYGAVKIKTAYGEAMRVNSAGNIGVASGLKFFLDGVLSTGDTYWWERSANVLGTSIGGVVGVETSGTAQTTDGATLVQAVLYAIPTDTTAILEFRVIGRNSSTGERYSYVGVADAKNVGGTATLGTVTNVYTNTGGVGAGPVLDATGASVRVRVIGGAGLTINWAASVRALERA